MTMGGSPNPGKRPWLSWLLLAMLVVALSITFVNLGQWQLDRLEQRRDRNEVVAKHENDPVADYASVMNKELGEDDQWQRVRVTGTFDAGHQLLVRYRSNADATGWEVVTPLRASDGRTVLVDRGFVARQAGTDFPTALPAPPSGTVTVTGHVRRNEQGKDNATVPQEGSVRLIDSDKIAPWYGRELVDGYIGLLEVDPPQGGGFQPVTTPPLDEGPHLSYALQWFAFSAVAGLGLVVFVRNDIRDRKKARARAARATVHPREE